MVKPIKPILLSLLCVGLLSHSSYVRCQKLSVANDQNYQGSKPALVISGGHSSELTGIAVSPNGRLVATSGADKKVILWDYASGELIRRFIGHKSGVSRVAFSPDGKYVLSTGRSEPGVTYGLEDLTARLWDVKTGKEVRRFALTDGYFTCFAFSPNSEYVITKGVENTARIWSIRSGKPVRDLNCGTDVYA